MKSILVAAEDPEALPSLLTTALLVARRFASRIEGVAVRQYTVPFVAAEGMSAAMTATLDTIEAEEKQRAETMRAAFQTFMAEHGVASEAAPGKDEAPTASWLSDDPHEAQYVGDRGRLFDLIVVARPGRGAIFPAISAAEAALFETGRPVLIAPPSPPQRLGEVIAIAWNGSSESARAVAFAMPLLLRAKNVYVIEAENGMVPGPYAAELRGYLVRHGIEAEARRIEPQEKAVGEAILDEARSLGADLLVKGAYTHSRLRQMIFGGVTSHILAEAELPVFMAH